MYGLAARRGIHGIPRRVRADLRRARPRRRRRVAWLSASVRRRWDRFLRPRRVAVALACGPRSVLCRAPERWLCLGAWTNWGQSAARWRIARWCWELFTDLMEKTAR